MERTCLTRPAVQEILRNRHRFMPADPVESAVRVAGWDPTQGGGTGCGVVCTERGRTGREVPAWLFMR